MLLRIVLSIFKQPRLLQLLLSNYKKIVLDEFRGVIRAMKIRFILYLLSFLFFGSGLLASIISLLLWAALPFLNPHNAWMMIALPIVLWVGSISFFILANRLKIQFNCIAMCKKIQSNIQLISQSLI